MVGSATVSDPHEDLPRPRQEREDRDQTSERGESAGEPLLRAGTTVGVAFVAALVGTAPAAFRVARALPGAGLFASWSMVGAAALLPAIALVAIFRGARRGGRTFMSERAREHGTTLFLFAALTPPFVVAFGALLRAKTHHHALAGVTFSIVTLLVLLGLGALSARLSHLLAARGPTLARAGFVVTFVAFLASLAWAGLKASRAGAPVAGAFLDTLALLLASGFGSRPGFLDTRVLAVLGPPSRPRCSRWGSPPRPSSRDLSRRCAPRSSRSLRSSTASPGVDDVGCVVRFAP